jgi:uncharacterized protein
VLVASVLAYVEVSASVASAGRSRRIGRAGLERAYDALGALWSEIITYDVDVKLGAVAARLAKRYTLSGADSVHLATAVEAGAVLATWDRRLVLAAEAEGVTVVGYG